MSYFWRGWVWGCIAGASIALCWVAILIPALIKEATK